MGMNANAYTTAWPTDSVARPTSRKILVVDDDPAMVRLLREFLEGEGYSVSCALDGQVALRLVHEHSFDLIIMDVNMPVTNGLQVLERLRASADTARIPVILVTGEPSGLVYPAVANDPRAAHVKKPVDLESFNSVIQFFLQRYSLA